MQLETIFFIPCFSLSFFFTFTNLFFASNTLKKYPFSNRISFISKHCSSNLWWSNFTWSLSFKPNNFSYSSIPISSWKLLHWSFFSLMFVGSCEHRRHFIFYRLWKKKIITFYYDKNSKTPRSVDSSCNLICLYAPEEITISENESIYKLRLSYRQMSEHAFRFCCRLKKTDFIYKTMTSLTLADG